MTDTGFLIYVMLNTVIIPTVRVDIRPSVTRPYSISTKTWLNKIKKKFSPSREQMDVLLISAQLVR